MAIPDQKYLPQAKGKKAKIKPKKVVEIKSFPRPTKNINTTPLKKKSPFGDNYVWSK